MFVTGSGMVCSVGQDASSACAAIRAGIANFVELPYRDNLGNPITGAMVLGLPDSLKREERLIRMLIQAVVECLGQGLPIPPRNIPLLIALAEPDRPGGGVHLAENIVRRVEARLGMIFHPSLSAVFATGHTAGFRALKEARELLRSGRAQACLVCGVDSYINPTSLLWLEHHLRLKTEENSDGVIPGEGAAAIFVQFGQAARGSLRVLGMGFAHEPASVLSEEPLLGIGLAQAAAVALSEAGVQMHEVDFRLSDVNGESYGFKEQALALARLMRHRREELPLWHIADSIGDTGAAAGVAQLVIAAHAFERHYAPGDRAICYSSGVLGDRAVIMVSLHASA